MPKPNIPSPYNQPRVNACFDEIPDQHNIINTSDNGAKKVKSYGANAKGISNPAITASTSPCQLPRRFKLMFTIFIFRMSCGFGDIAPKCKLK